VASLGPTRLLFGRRTYALFRLVLRNEDPGSHPIADALNTNPKYVASTTITDPRWRTRRSSPVTSRRPSES